ncbi:hypothetical protein QUF72_15565 [Desulfobacterales bacterium HSG2]|nr:hypothetical protein [Desulfobacterales bacterium HSG2]
MSRKSGKKKNSRRRRRISITFTVLIWLGIIMTATGVIVSILDINGVTTFEFTWNNITFKAIDTGLIIMITGALLAGVIAVRLPKDVEVFSARKLDITEKISEMLGLPLILLSALGIILLVLSFIIG